MKLCSFAEINDAENGQQIPSFQGTIKKVFDPKTGVGEYGPWSIQRLILQDEHANEITVTWTCEDPWQESEQGKVFLFESGHDKKDQLCGLKKEIRTKNSKTYESVKVDNRAKVRPIDHSTEVKDEPEISLYEDWGVPVASPELPVSSPSEVAGVTETRKHLMQSANLQVLCINAVNGYVADHCPEVARTSEQFQGLVAQLFIEASGRRTNDGVHWWSYVDLMPTHPIKK